MRQLTLASLTVALLCVPSGAQDDGPVLYGSVDDLKGVRTVFIYTKHDTTSRDKIIKELKKRLPNLILTDDAETAEVALVLALVEQTVYTGSTTRSQTTRDGDTSRTRASTSPQYGTLRSGRGLIYRQRNGELYLIKEYRDVEGHVVFERNPATNFAREFVKLYEQANGKQKK